MMIREKLTQAVATAALNCGYTFFCGALHRMSREMTAVPAAWLVPPEVTGVNGYEQGEMIYKILIKLVDIDKGYTAGQKDELWAKMEQHAMAIYQALAENPSIQAVTSLQWAPKEYSYTQHAELSLDLSMKVEMAFNNQNLK